MKQRTIIKLFQPRFGPQIKRGEKATTIRPNPKRPQDMPKVGDRISLRQWSGKPYRSKQIVLGESVITRVEQCRIDEYGASVGDLWSSGEGLAISDGFIDFQEMLGWFNKTHGLPFAGILIAWEPLKP